MKISVVTAVLNRSGTIAHAMSSVQEQTHGDVEHVIQDGQSTDGTLDKIRDHMTDQTLLVSEPDNGIYDGINRGISRATGDVIGLLHSDDFFGGPATLEKIAAAFDPEGVDGVYGDLQYVSASDPRRVIRYWRAGEFDRRKLARGWMPPHPTLFLRREVFDRWGAYDTSYEIAADYDAILRWLARGGVSLAYIPEVLVKMRVGGESNRSLSRILRKSREDYRALRSNNVGGMGTLVLKNMSKIGQFFIRPSGSQE
ncbi:MAG: glycosyltransferase [Woeseia sp.]|nr:glycosyltransferase [Woeseia sp.]